MRDFLIIFFSVFGGGVVSAGICVSCRIPARRTIPEYGEYQQYDARVEVVAFHTAPHFEYEFGAVAEVAYHGAAFHHFPVGILHGVYLQAVRTHTFTEEIAEVGTCRDGGVPFGFHDFGGWQRR